MNLSKEKLEQLLTMIADTCHEDTIDCDECLKHIAQYAEEYLQELSSCEQVKAVRKHLDCCICCQHEFEAFLLALKALNESDADEC